MGRGQGRVAESLQPRGMRACGVYLILRFVQISNRSPPQPKSEASVPIFRGRECLYPIPLSTCLNIYFVNRDVSRFCSFPAPLTPPPTPIPIPIRAEGRPPLERAPLPPVSLPTPSTTTLAPVGPKDSSCRGLSPTGGTSQLGEGERGLQRDWALTPLSPQGGGRGSSHLRATFLWVPGRPRGHREDGSNL